MPERGSLSIKAEAAAKATAVLTVIGAVAAAMENLPVNTWMPVAMGLIALSAGVGVLAKTSHHTPNT
jgi:hypothetical protein